MSVITVNSADATLVLNGRTIEDIPEGDMFTIAFGNDITKQTQGVSGGKVIKSRNDKDDGLLTIRVLRYSADDAYLTNQINASDGPVVLEGSLKENFVRDGVDGVETHSISGGSLATRGDNTKNNTDGDDIQEYTILATIIRSL